jgi:D-hydroxyproline dehydrogenase subunit alpha
MRHVAVVGGGPAGLSAAAAALARGARVTLIDQGTALGGQYWRRGAVRSPMPLHDHGRFERLRHAIEDDERATVLRASSVWSVDPRDDGPPVLHVLSGDADGTRNRRAIAPDALVLATGAHDRALPVPGWQLPGVYTAGGAQALAKGEGLAVGRRVAISGTGPFLLPVAEALSSLGAEVAGVFEANRWPAIARGWSPRPWRLLPVARKGGELAGYVGGMLRNRVPYRAGAAVVAIHGTGRVEAVTVAELDPDWRPRPGTERRIAVDAVCLGHGFTPRLELAIASGCRLTPTRFVEVDAAQRTTVRGVFAAGEITGIGGADLACAEGEVAGIAAAGGDSVDARAAMTARKRYRDFAARIDAAHGIGPAWPEWLSDDTLVCRCEDVSYGRLRGTVRATGSASLRTAKLATRAGLGICQGRTCGRTVESLLARDAPGGRLLDDAVSDRRPIATPIRLGELAADEPTTD